MVDEKITWKAHIKYLYSKLAKSIGVLAKAKHVLNSESLYVLYCSLVLPYLSYCAEIWGNTYETNIDPIVCLQKRAIRIVHKVGYRSHTNSLFVKSKVLKFKDLVEYLTVIIMYKARDNKLPRNIQKHFKKREDSYNLRGIEKFKQAAERTNRKSFCVSVCGVKLWNSLSDELRGVQIRGNLKRNLKRPYYHDMLKGTSNLLQEMNIQHCYVKTSKSKVELFG